MEVCSDRMNCNDRPIIQEYCYTSVNAITGAKSISEPSKKCAYNLSPLGCYHFVDYSKGIAEKGCIADLPNDRIKAMKENLSFKTCVGNNCNLRLEFLSCASFVSKIYDKIDERSIESKVCNNYDDKCFVYGNYWTVEYGCLSDASEDIQQICKANNKKCETCDINYCNMPTVIPQKFCYSLKYKKTDNITLKPEHSKRCYFAKTAMGCYHVENPADGSVKKGCVSDLSAAELSAYSKGPALYKICSGNNCNSREMILSCLSCKSKEANDSCALNQNKVANKVCDNYHDKCYAHATDDRLFERGCLKEASPDIASNCSQIATDKCSICDDKINCNDQCVREECLKQEYKKGSVVVVQSNTTERCSLQSKPFGCYHYEDNATDIVRKGCVADLATTVLSEYTRQKPQFQICLGNSCNYRYELFSCLSCLSSSNNTECLTDIENMTTIVCSRYHDRCFLRVSPNNIERGCLSTATTEVVKDCRSNRHKCMTCSDHKNCNNQVKTYEYCDSWRYDPTRRLEPMEKEPISVKCSLTIPPLGCYHFENPDKRVVNKGCISDLKASELEKYQQQQQFFIRCAGDNCNSGARITSCLTCKSNGSNSHCVTDFTNVTVQACQIYGDKCYTHISKNNFYDRGCLSAASPFVQRACESQQGKCKICVDNNCNDYTAADHCISCDSKSNQNCRSEPNKITDILHCTMKASHDRSASAGCYLKFDSKNVSRGCVEDLSEKERNECTSTNNNNCQICKGHGCNAKASFHQSCYKCSSASLKSCLNLSGPKVTAKCVNYTGSCLVGIDAEGYTHRTCGYSEQENRNNFPIGYQICYSEQCNDFAFPGNSLHCYQCEDCTNLDSEYLDICGIYSETNRCYTYRKGNQHLDQHC